MRLLIPVVAAMVCSTAWAAIYTAPSGSLQIIGYALQHVQRDGHTELALSGHVEALADCKAAVLIFDVLDREDRPVATLRIAHGEFFRHDVWELGQGELTPVQGDVAQAVADADHVRIRQADCTRGQ
jgi:hypothetical protein